MTIAEKKALEAYPPRTITVFGPLPCDLPSVIDDDEVAREAYKNGYEQALQDVKHTVFDHQIKAAYESAKHNANLPVSEIWSKTQKEKAMSNYQAFSYCLSRLQEAGVINDDWRESKTTEESKTIKEE